MSRFHVAHSKDARFSRRGLRGYFEYRDLGIKRALFEYEGVGKVRMKAGSCFYQPPNIRHRELAHSRNLEMIEVVSPADFKTRAARAARKSPARRSRG